MIVSTTLDERTYRLTPETDDEDHDVLQPMSGSDTSVSDAEVDEMERKLRGELEAAHEAPEMGEFYANLQLSSLFKSAWVLDEVRIGSPSATLVRVGELILARVPLVRSIYSVIKQVVETIASNDASSPPSTFWIRSATTSSYSSATKWAIGWPITKLTAPVATDAEHWTWVRAWIPLSPEARGQNQLLSGMSKRSAMAEALPVTAGSVAACDEK